MNAFRWLPLGLALVLPPALNGCSADYYAGRILVHNTAPGKVAEFLTGSADDLIRQGRITDHRVIRIDQDVCIDTWVLRAKPEPGRTARGSVVLIHGLMDSKARMLGIARRLSGAGFHAVMIDQRCHGRSTGRYVTWGALEKHDVKTVMDSLLAEGLIGGDIYAYGMSMGAATAVLYGAIDARCRGVVALAPYADAREVCRHAVPLMSQDLFDRAWALAASRGGFDPDQASPVRAAAGLQCPLTVIHGQLDSVVPHDHGRRVYEACPAAKKFVSIPLAGHLNILLGREEWLAGRVIELAPADVSPLPPRAAACDRAG